MKIYMGIEPSYAVGTSAAFTLFANTTGLIGYTVNGDTLAIYYGTEDMRLAIGYLWGSKDKKQGEEDDNSFSFDRITSKQGV